jgi:eukaryotic-like serine/threonine-protein kinase
VGMRNTEDRDEIEIYHDRIREVVASKLDKESLRGHHGRLAAVLEASGRANPEALAVHFQGAGDRGKASQYAQSAAEQASAALAFERAARLYRLALDLRSGQPGETRDLQVKLGEALSNAGRGEEAAKAYLRATDGAAITEKLEWQRRAAAQLLMSGHIDQGLVVIRKVLDSVGMRLAPAPWRALLSLLIGRARVRLRGLTFPGA